MLGAFRGYDLLLYVNDVLTENRTVQHRNYTVRVRLGRVTWDSAKYVIEIIITK